MAKKRTGLQSEISSIFSGVPLPKKGTPPEESPEVPVKAAGQKPPVAPAQPPVSSKPAAAEPPEPAPSATPKPASVAQPKVPEPAVIAQPVKVPASPPAPKVTEIGKPVLRAKQIPVKVPRRRKDRAVGTKAGVSAGRQKASIVMVVVLTISLVYLLARPYYNSRNDPVSVNAANQTNVSVAPEANININWKDPPVYPPFIRDPMDPESKGRIVENNDKLIVRGIVYSEDEPAALIDQQLFHVGDTVRGAKIMKIERNSVTFEKEGKTWTQEVQGQDK